jgi:hypothetical protein
MSSSSSSSSSSSLDSLLHSIQSLNLNNELLDFNNKLKEILSLQNELNTKCQKQENNNLALIARTEEILNESEEINKDCSQLYYQQYMMISYYEDTSYEFFELMNKSETLLSFSSSSASVEGNSLELSRNLFNMKEKFFSMQGMLCEYQKKIQDNLQIQTVLLNEQSLEKLLDDIGKKMELLEEKLRFLEDRMMSQEDLLLQEEKGRQPANEKETKKKALSSSVLLLQQQKRIYKKISQQMKQRYRPVLSLNLFEECLETEQRNSNNERESEKKLLPSSPRSLKKNSRAVAKESKEEIEKREELRTRAKAKFSPLLLKEKERESEREGNGRHVSPPLPTNYSDHFKIKSPELGNWSYLAQTPMTKTDKTINNSSKKEGEKKEMINNRTKLDFDETKSPLKNALDKINNLSYTIVPVKDTTSTTSPASSSSTSVSSFTPSTGTFSSPVSTAERQKKGGAAAGTGGGDAFSLLKSALSPSTVGEPSSLSGKKANRRIALEENDELTRDGGGGGDDGEREGRRKHSGSISTNLEPETIPSPLTLPTDGGGKSSKREGKERAGSGIFSFLPKEEGTKAAAVAAPASALTTEEEVIQKIKDLYQQYNPEKLSDIPALLKKYSGKTKELYDKLVQKYVKAGTSAPVVTGTAPPTAATTPSLFGNASNTSKSPFATTATAAGSSPLISLSTSTAANNTFGSFSLPSTTGANSGNSTSNNDNNNNKFFTIVTEIYQKYNPSKLDEIPNTLQKYAGKELELIGKLKKKYNIMEPIASESQLFPSGSSGVALAPTASLFGGSGGVGSNQPSSLFASPLSNASTTTSLFPSSSAASTSLTPNQPSLFGNNAPSGSLFGGNNTNNTASSVFSGGSTGIGGGGGGAVGGGGGLFGGTGNNQSKSPFANNTNSNTSTTPSLFGGGNTTSLLGGTSPFQQPQQSQVFQQQQQQSSLFGGNNNNTTNINDIRVKVLEIYKQFNPTKITEIPKLLEKYRGKEHELIQKLEQKYGTGGPGVTTPVGGGGGGFGGSSVSSFGSSNTGSSLSSSGFGSTSGFGMSSLGGTGALGSGLGIAGGGSGGLGTAGGFMGNSNNAGVGVGAAPSLFGGNNSNTSNSLFSTPAAATSPFTSPLINANNMTGQSPFGMNSAGNNTNRSLFGGGNQQQQTTPFGNQQPQQQQPVTSAFGTPSSSLFGGNTGGGIGGTANRTSPSFGGGFGTVQQQQQPQQQQMAGFGQQPRPLFGQSSGFGNPTPFATTTHATNTSGGGFGGFGSSR